MECSDTKPNVMTMEVSGNSKKHKNGSNIVNKIDNPVEFSANFVNYYLENILTGKDTSMFRVFSIFRYSNTDYQNAEIVKLLSEMNRCDIKIQKIETLPSGSRRFDIMVIGTVDSNFFSQYFMLNHESADIWYIKSSIITIL